MIAVSSFLRTALRCWMTVGSPSHSRPPMSSLLRRNPATNAGRLRSIRAVDLAPRLRLHSLRAAFAERTGRIFRIAAGSRRPGRPSTPNSSRPAYAGRRSRSVSPLHRQTYIGVPAIPLPCKDTALRMVRNCIRCMAAARKCSAANRRRPPHPHPSFVRARLGAGLCSASDNRQSRRRTWPRPRPSDATPKSPMTR